MSFEVFLSLAAGLLNPQRSCRNLMTFEETKGNIEYQMSIISAMKK